MLAQIKIAPVKSAILIIYDWFNYLIISYLLSDAELWKNGVEDLIGGYLASNLAKVVENTAQIITQKIAG